MNKVSNYCFPFGGAFAETTAEFEAPQAFICEWMFIKIGSVLIPIRRYLFSIFRGAGRLFRRKQN